MIKMISWIIKIRGPEGLPPSKRLVHSLAAGSEGLCHHQQRRRCDAGRLHTTTATSQSLGRRHDLERRRTTPTCILSSSSTIQSSVTFFSAAHIMTPDAEAEFFAENAGHFRNGVYNDDSEYDFILLIVTDNVPVEVSDFSRCTGERILTGGLVHQQRPSAERKRCGLQDGRVSRHVGQSACSRLER